MAAGLDTAIVRAIIDASPEEKRQLAAALAPYLPQQDSADDPLLNTEEAARYLRLSKGTIYNLRSSREIEPENATGRPLYRKSKLDAWLRARQS